MTLGNKFEFSEADYNEMYNLIFSKVKSISDNYTIADISLELQKLIFDVLYDIEIELTQI